MRYGIFRRRKINTRYLLRTLASRKLNFLLRVHVPLLRIFFQYKWMLGGVLKEQRRRRPSCRNSAASVCSSRILNKRSVHPCCLLLCERVTAVVLMRMYDRARQRERERENTT